MRNNADIQWLTSILHIESTEENLNYGLVNLPNGQTFLISLKSHRSAEKALLLYPAQNPIAKMSKYLFRMGLSTGLGQPYLKKIGLKETNDKDNFKNRLKSIFNRQDIQVSFFIARPGPYRKPLLQITSNEGEILGYGKIGWNSITNDLVQNEQKNLKALGKMRLAYWTFPNVLYGETIAGNNSFLITSPLDLSNTGKHLVSERHLDALAEIFSKDMYYDAFSDSHFYKQITKRYLWLNGIVPANQNIVLDKAIRFLEEQFGQRELPWGRRVGDFTPWNVSFDPNTNKFNMVDLEFGEENSLVGWDLLHYFHQSQTLRLKVQSNADRVRLLRKNFSIYGIEDIPVSFFYLAYMVDIWLWWRMEWHRCDVKISAEAEKWFLSNLDIINRLSTN